MLYIVVRHPDGVFDRHGRFYPLREPRTADLDTITHTIARRVSCYLEKAGYLILDAESAYLDLQPDADDAMTTIVGASTEASDRSYRLAFGPNAGLGVPEVRHSHSRHCPPVAQKTSSHW